MERKENMDTTNNIQTVNIFDREVSWFTSIYEKESRSSYSFKILLTDYGGEMISDIVDKYRNNMTKENKLNLPCYTPSGIFKTKTNDGLIQHNGVVCIDIDFKDNLDVENFEDIRDLIDEIPYIAYCGHSCSGQGYYVLIPIENPEKHQEHYEAICDDFERCNISVDRACSNISRTRSVLFDEGAYMNERAQVYTRTKKVKHDLAKDKDSSHAFDDSQNADKIQSILAWIKENEIDITGKERQWYEIGAALAHELGEEGREIFHEVSKYYPTYSERETNYKFNHCLKQSAYTIGTFIHYAKENGWKMF